MTTPAPPPVLAPPESGPVVTPEALAAQAVADGAQAQGVSDDQIAAMQAQMAAMQKTIDKLNTEKSAQFASETDKYAAAVADQLAAFAAAHPDVDYTAGIKLAAELADGQDVAGKLSAWLGRMQRRSPGTDHGYVAELLDEHADAADAATAQG